MVATERRGLVFSREGALNRSIRENLTNALSPHDKKRGPAWQALVSSVRNYPSLNPFFMVANQLEEASVTAPDKRVKMIADYFLPIFLAKAGPLLHDVKSINLQHTVELKQAAKAMLKRRTDDAPFSKLVDYEHFFGQILTAIMQHPSDGSSLEIAIRNPSGASEAESIKVEEWNTWTQELNRSMGLKDAEHDLDNTIEWLRREPSPNPLGDDTMFERRYAETSLADIESLPYPITEEDYGRITDYLIEVLTTSSYAKERAIQMRVFFSPQNVYPPAPGELPNQPLPLIVNTWQGEFIRRVMFPQSEAEEAQTRRVLSAIPDDSVSLLVGAALSWSMHTIHNNPAAESQEFHPLAAELVNQFDKEHPHEGQMFMYIHELANTYFHTFTASLLKSRLKGFGFLKKFDRWVDIIDEVLKRNPFAKEHLDDMKKAFTHEVGEGFLTQLRKDPMPQLVEVAQTAWEQIRQAEQTGVIPALDGVKIVHSSKDMFSDIIGVARREMVTLDLPNGKREVSFRFVLRGGFALIGKLTPQGRLELRAPLEKEVPGLFAILQFIAVSTFDDLARQAKADQEEEEMKKKAGKRMRGRIRTEQSDHDLIKDVFKRTTPYTYRWVHIHPQHLPYGKRYADTVATYEAGQMSEEEVIAARERAVRFSPSEEKLRNVNKLPADMQNLEIITDPINGRQIATETWAIPHPSPHPTDEEKKSPKTLFEKYYRRGKGSAVAMMEEIKEWLINQANRAN